MAQQESVNTALVEALEHVLGWGGPGVPGDLRAAAEQAIEAAKAQPPQAETLSLTDCLQLHCVQCDGKDLDVIAFAKFRPNERWRLIGFVESTQPFYFCHTCNAHVSVKEHA